MIKSEKKQKDNKTGLHQFKWYVFSDLFYRFIARYTGIHANIKYELLDEISRDPFSEITKKLVDYKDFRFIAKSSVKLSQVLPIR